MGVWNKYAVLNFYGGFDHFLCAGRDVRPVRFLGLLELVRWIRNLLPGVSIQWGSVIYFPLQWYTFMAGFELRNLNRNPSGFLDFLFQFKRPTGQFRMLSVNLWVLTPKAVRLCVVLQGN
jgi:hypothetical protein